MENLLQSNINSIVDTKEKVETFSDIIYALDALRDEAKEHKLEEVEAILAGTFEICLNTFYLLKRRQLQSVLKTDFIAV